MNRYKSSEIDKLSEILKTDGVISVPTDTVYGVCARICSKTALNNLIKLKNRPLNKLFPIMCADEEQIQSIAIIDEKSKCLIHNFMPGPITLILKKKLNVPEFVNNGNDTLAIRMATSKPIAEMIKKTGCPIFMSSANISGNLPCSTLDEIENTFPNLNGIMEGNILFGQGSTIVDCSGEKIKILRGGPISINQITQVLDNYELEKN